MSKKILYITGSLPSLTSTFIYREILALERTGARIDIVSMNRPPGEEISEDAAHFQERTLYLDEIGLGRKLFGLLVTFLLHPIRTAKTFWIMLWSRPRRSARDFARLAYHYIEAAYLSRMLNLDEIHHIHAHFVHGPSSIAMYLSCLTNIPFSFTMHGSLIYKDPVGLAEKLKRCKFAVSISDYHRSYVVETYGEHHRQKISIVRCGLLMEQFPEPVGEHTDDDELRILGIGRLIEVKGFEYLVRACDKLQEMQIPFSCQIVGDGPEKMALQQLIDESNLSDHVQLAGAKLQGQLPEYFSDANVFCLPCIVGRDGSMDGLPVVLMEALAWKIPVISSRLAGIPELVEDGATGILAEPKDVEALAAALVYLRNHPDVRRSYGELGRKRVVEEFTVMNSATKLASLFGID